MCLSLFRRRVLYIPGAIQHAGGRAHAIYTSRGRAGRAVYDNAIHNYYRNVRKKKQQTRDGDTRVRKSVTAVFRVVDSGEYGRLTIIVVFFLFQNFNNSFEYNYVENNGILRIMLYFAFCRFGL